MNYKEPNYNETYEPSKQASRYNIPVNPKTHVVMTVLEKLGRIRRSMEHLIVPVCPLTVKLPFALADT